MRRTVMCVGSRGQIWSSDLAVSLAVFSIAAVIAFTMVINSIDGNDYDDVRKQAYGTAALLVGEGYPAHWSNDTVIRAGLVSDHHVSLRKANEMANMNRNQLRSALRVTDNVYVYFTNSSNDTVSIFGKCGIGDAVVAATGRNETLPALAMGNGTTITDRVNASRLSDQYYNLTSQDVIIIEGALSSNLSSSEVMRVFDAAAKRGMTMVIIGNPGIPILGIEVNATPVDDVDVLREEPMLRLTPETLAISGMISTINEPNSSAVSNFRTIATGNNSIVMAAWTYHDAQVWYLATATGTHADGTALEPTIGNATQAMIEVPRPTCQLPDVQGEQVVMHTRTIPYHDELLRMHVLVWRG